jgi:hypothetical protein
VSKTAYTQRATAAILQAARPEHDFGGWLAHVLATAAGQLGSSDALVEGRPGSWEAALVDQLVKGTVGHDDAYLPAPSGRAKLTDDRVRRIREAYEYAGLTQRQIAGVFGIARSTVSAIVTRKTWDWLS